MLLVLTDNKIKMERLVLFSHLCSNQSGKLCHLLFTAKGSIGKNVDFGGDFSISIGTKGPSVSAGHGLKKASNSLKE